MMKVYGVDAIWEADPRCFPSYEEWSCLMYMVMGCDWKQIVPYHEE